MGRSVGKARGAESRASGKAPYFQRGVTATRVEEGFFSKFPLDHVSTSVARSVNLFPSLSLSLPLPFSFPRTHIHPFRSTASPPRLLSLRRALSRAFYSHSNGSTLICMLRVLAGLPATLPSGFPFKLTKWRWLRGATKFFIERFDVDSVNGRR